MKKILAKLTQTETAGGLLLVLATLCALFICNSELVHSYRSFLRLPVSIHLGNFKLDKPLILWVNDGLMAIFFFMIGLELKREVLAGHLKDVKNIIVPSFAALGGVVVPILIFFLFNRTHEQFSRGWAVPMATDIAFALGIMSLFSERISQQMKIFLLTLAIIDDLLAIIVIAIFHTSSLSSASMLAALVCICVLFLLNYFKVKNVIAYFFVGGLLWLSVLKSGVHATLAGVILSFFIPMKENNNRNLLEHIEEQLAPLVSFVILPLFAFVNAGVNLRKFTLSSFAHTVPLGIAFGLAFGKPIGVFLFTSLSKKFTRSKLTLSNKQILILGCFAGIGFTMSLFIDTLSFGHYPELLAIGRLGILVGSGLAIIMACSLTLTLPKRGK